MLAEFREYLLNECGVLEGRILVAVSGGIDSVVMAHLFRASRLTFAIAHCNFTLRDNDSDDDELFVRDLADQFQVPFFTEKFNTREYAATNSISLQMAARDLRYSWFQDLADKQGFTFISVGHNRNDIVETVLLNLSRGTGFRGLMGIRARHRNIIRPLLFATRTQITEYAHSHNIKWREDSTNSETKYIRNKIRHTIIPEFESLNPSFIPSAIDTATRIELTGKLLDLQLQSIKKEIWNESAGRVSIDINLLKKYPSIQIILFELLRDYGVSQLSSEMLVNTIEASTGKQFYTRTHTITRNRDYLIVTKKAADANPEILINPDVVMIDHPVKLTFRTVLYRSEFVIPSERNIAALDADKLQFPLLLRSWKNGDRFQPLGMSGTKKISDYLINQKVALPDKDEVRVIESKGEIVWVVNHRIDDRFKVKPDTLKIFIIECHESCT